MNKPHDMVTEAAAEGGGASQERPEPVAQPKTYRATSGPTSRAARAGRDSDAPDSDRSVADSAAGGGRRDDDAPRAGGEAAVQPGAPDDPATDRPTEIGGRPGPDPTRYGDWEKNGRCIDF